MKTTDESQGILKDVLLWVLVAALTVVAFILTYYYQFSGPSLSMIWVLWFVSVMLFAYMTTIGHRVYQFALDAKIELLKVVWPTRQETTQTTMIVIAMVAFTGLVLWAIDSMMIWAIAKITHLR